MIDLPLWAAATSYPTLAGSKVGGTSAEAAEKIENKRLQGMALETLKKHPAGMTADEIAAALCLSILSIRPRISELKRLGKVQKTNQRRQNASGMTAIVWITA